MDFLLIAVALFLLALFGGIVYFIVRAMRQHRARQEALRRLAGTKEDNLVAGQIYHGSVDDIAYQYQFNAGSRNEPASLRVWVMAPSQGEFRVSRRTWFDRFGKAVGLSNDVTTGDADFDRDYYLTTESRVFTSTFFHNPNKVDVTQDLFRLGFNEVLHNGDFFQATWTGFDPTKVQDSTLLGDVGMRLYALSDEIPSVEEEEQAKIGFVRRHIFWVLPCIGFVAGLATLIFANHAPLDSWDSFLFSLRYSLPALLTYVVLAGWGLRGRSSSHREWLVATLLSLIAFPLGGLWFTWYLNGALDTGRATTHRLQVLRADSRRSRNSTSYYAIVKSHRKGEDSFELRIDSTLFGRLQFGNGRATVVAKPGRFGFEWIESYKIDTR